MTFWFWMLVVFAGLIAATYAMGCLLFWIFGDESDDDWEQWTP